MLFAEGGDGAGAEAVLLVGVYGNSVDVKFHLAVDGTVASGKVFENVDEGVHTKMLVLKLYYDKDSTGDGKALLFGAMALAAVIGMAKGVLARKRREE